MDILLILGLVFLSLVLSTYFMLNMTASTVERYSASVTEQTESHLRKMYVFADTKKLLLLYLLVLAGVPLALHFLGQPLPFVVVALVIMLIFPRWMMKRMADRRKRAINNALPDALSQIAGSMRAGSTLTIAIQAMVEEQGGPIAQEFGHLLREQRVGLRFDEALDNLAERVQTEEMDLVVSAALISLDVGGNLAETFHRLGETLRRKLEMEGKVKALTSQGVLQGKTVSALPFLIMIALMQIEKEAMAHLFTGVLGWVFLAVIVVLEVCGGLMIRKIVSIDI
ncbi:MAG: secretion system protein [Gammaproteobacteria bacterium]|nr:MAG: secretion system protein [Gammaproteobacteria bacterium]